MAALGVLFTYILYAVVLLSGIFFGFKIFGSKRTIERVIFSILCLSCFGLLALMTVQKKDDEKEESLKFAGTYNLTKYPNCDSCKAILRSDNSFEIISYKTNGKDTVLEKGSWHFVSEGDFIGVYMDVNETYLLGSGRFDYSSYIDR
nr:hypothetical protein [uncultured Flavobacterium sp.]